MTQSWPFKETTELTKYSENVRKQTALIDTAINII
jgi:hypothetical protein